MDGFLSLGWFLLHAERPHIYHPGPIVQHADFTIAARVHILPLRFVEIDFQIHGAVRLLLTTWLVCVCVGGGGGGSNQCLFVECKGTIFKKKWLNCSSIGTGQRHSSRLSQRLAGFAPPSLAQDPPPQHATVGMSHPPSVCVPPYLDAWTITPHLLL